MAENPVIPRQETHPDDAPPPTQVLASEDLKKLSATLTEIAADVKAERTKLSDEAGRAQKILDDIKKEQAKLQPVATKEPNRTGPMTLKRLMAIRTNDKTVIEAQELMNRALCRTILRLGKRNALPLVQDGERQVVDMSRLDQKALQETPEFQDAITTLAAGSFIDTATATSGAEWVPTGFARTAVDFYFTDSSVEAAIQQQIIPDGVGPFSIPIETARAQAVIEAQQTAVSANYISTTGLHTPLTDTVDFVPKKLALGYQWSGEANEDIAVDMLQRALRQCPAGIRRGIRQCLINGQTASDATLDDAPAVSGLQSADGWSDANGTNSWRLQCVNNVAFNTAVGGPLTYTDIITARKAMGKFGVNPRELAIPCSPMAYISLLGDDAHVVTMEKYGPQAAVLTGELARVGGVPLFPDGEFSDLMDPAGINAGTGTKGGALVVNLLRWWLATKRSITTTIIPGIGMENATVISRWRGDTKTAIDTEHNVHYLVDIS